MCLKCLNVWELKASTEDAQTNGLNFRNVCMFVHAITFSFPLFHVEAEHNKAPAVWACSSECPLSLMLTSCPFISPHLLRDAAPREISEGSMGNASLERWCVVTTCACFAALQVFWYICFVLFFQVWVCIPSVRTKRQDRHYLSSLSTFLKPFYRRKVNRKNEGYLHQLIQLVFILKCGGGFIQWDAGWTVCSLAQRWELTLCAVSLQHNTHEFKWLHLLFFSLCTHFSTSFFLTRWHLFSFFHLLYIQFSPHTFFF